MRFEPKSEDELNKFSVMPAGDYDFEVKDAEEQLSKAGNEMTKLTLAVYDNDGEPNFVFDYLVASAKSMFKLSTFAKSVGLYSNYEAGNIPADLMIGRIGRCKLGIEPANGQYAAKNKVLSYYEMKGGQAPANNPKPAQGSPMPDLDDSIPFAPEFR